MMIGRTRLAVGPLRDLRQLDATIARISGITGVGAVKVDALDGRRAMLTMQVLRPLELEDELRAALGPGLASCGPRGDRLELVLRDPDVAPPAAGASPGGDLVRWSAPRQELSWSGRSALGRHEPAAGRDEPEWPDPAASPWADEAPRWAATATARLIGEELEGAPAARGTGTRGRTAIRGFLAAAQG